MSTTTPPAPAADRPARPKIDAALASWRALHVEHPSTVHLFPSPTATPPGAYLAFASDADACLAVGDVEPARWGIWFAIYAAADLDRLLVGLFALDRPVAVVEPVKAADVPAGVEVGRAVTEGETP